MRIFKGEFLGRSRIARDCIIMNEEYITLKIPRSRATGNRSEAELDEVNARAGFNYHSDRDTLRAIARKPMVILNNALGYQITYHLDKFEYDKVHKTTAFYGNIIFNLDMAINRKSKKEF